MRVVVQGRLKSRQYETREGEKRTVFEIDVDEVGPSLKYATAKVTRTTRSGGGGGFSGGGGQGGGDNDPWATPAPQGGQSGGYAGGQQGGGQGGQAAPANDPWGAPGVSSEEPPF
jgi:single-strand DNA-binding protein